MRVVVVYCCCVGAFKKNRVYWAQQKGYTHVVYNAFVNVPPTRNNSHPLTSARLKPSACASILGGGLWHRIIFSLCPPGRLGVASGSTAFGPSSSEHPDAHPSNLRYPSPFPFTPPTNVPFCSAVPHVQRFTQGGIRSCLADKCECDPVVLLVSAV